MLGREFKARNRPKKLEAKNDSRRRKEPIFLPKQSEQKMIVSVRLVRRDALLMSMEIGMNRSLMMSSKK